MILITPARARSPGQSSPSLFRVCAFARLRVCALATWFSLPRCLTLAQPMSTRTSNDISPGGRPLELLFEHRDLPRFELPDELAASYGGGLGFAGPCMFANFVASLDGVVALSGDTESGQIISGRNPADRFVMGLLRACADAVVVGAGTFRKSSGHLWYPDRIYPAAAALFADARQRLGLATVPQFVLVSASGEIDVSEPAVAGALI